jgi:hypothetical protein
MADDAVDVVVVVVALVVDVDDEEEEDGAPSCFASTHDKRGGIIWCN